MFVSLVQDIVEFMDITAEFMKLDLFQTPAQIVI